MNSPIDRPVKHFICIFLFSSYCTCAQLSTFVSDVHDSMLTRYKNDADRLALRQALSGKSLYKDSISIDKKLSDRYFKALMAVYNARHLPARDTVVRYLGIHSYNPGMRSIVIRGLGSLVWMTDLRNNRFPTGNSTLNFLMRKYELEKSFYSNLFQPNLVVLKSRTNYNLEALGCSFESVYGATGIQPEFLYGDGSDIFDTIASRDIELTYSFGWNNCRSECRSRRYWKFKVKEDFSVEYLGSWGQTLEPGLEMKLYSGENNFTGLNIYPNPVKDLLYVEFGSGPIPELKLSIVNLKGDVVFTRSNIKPGDIINLGHMLRGVYFMNLESGGLKKVYNLIKNRNPGVGE